MDVENRKEQAYTEIKKRIMSGRYRPGEVFSESAMVTDLGISRTPIREALVRLEQEGLVRVIPKCGVTVRALTLSDLKALFEMRRILEPYVIRRYGHNIPRDQLLDIWQEMTQAYTASDSQRQYNADARLHSLIYSTAQNPYITKFVEQAVSENTRIRALSGILPARLTASYMEHKAIVDHLLAGDWEAAACSMEQHLSIAFDQAVQKLL